MSIYCRSLLPPFLIWPSQGADAIPQATNRFNWISLFFLGFIFLGGCTQTQVLRKNEVLEQPTEPIRVLLMPLEVELGELTAGGLVEPRADWTQAAQQHLTLALKAFLSAKNAILVPYNPPAHSPQKAHHHHQLIKLHQAITKTILNYKYNKQSNLPTKEGKFDWTLGEGVKALGKDFDADYALFIFIHDTYTSAERNVISFLFSVLFLFPIHPGSVQQGIASLVDLNDGDIEWFNRFVSYTGDLRNAGDAQTVIHHLLTDLPLSTTSN